jgi:hypothetical protein
MTSVRLALLPPSGKFQLNCLRVEARLRGLIRSCK